MALMSGSSMKGSWTWARATRTPSTVNKSFAGASRRPELVSTVLTSPCLPRITIHANERTTALVSSGRSVMNRMVSRHPAPTRV